MFTSQTFVENIRPQDFLGVPLRVGLSVPSPRGFQPLRAFHFYPSRNSTHSVCLSVSHSNKNQEREGEKEKFPSGYIHFVDQSASGYIPSGLVLKGFVPSGLVHEVEIPLTRPCLFLCF